MNPSTPWITHPWVTEGADKLRFGIGLPFWSQSSTVEDEWATRRDLVQAVDEFDFDSLWALDHPAVWADCWITLTAYATATRRVRLGSLVSCALYRSPWMLARQAVDVDRLSGGRLILGIGAGWFENDFTVLRVPFPPTADRLRHLTETVREVRRLLSTPSANMLGGSSEEILAGGLSGTAVQQPSIPFLVGGSGERMILRLIAKYSDMCNVEEPKAPTAAEVQHKFAVLRRYCAEQGRSDGSIIRSHFLSFAALGETESELVEKVARLTTESQGLGLRSFTFRDLVGYYRTLIDAGSQYLILVPLLGIDIATLRLVAEKVIPELQDYYASNKH
jgi:alkanesulfonate monooxygenase SsuD/methylene tetrahydromethanopterin reductase-like flavin-dependent oxidoreductase (luciferase family)